MMPATRPSAHHSTSVLTITRLRALIIQHWFRIAHNQKKNHALPTIKHKAFDSWTLLILGKVCQTKLQASKYQQLLGFLLYSFKIPVLKSVWLHWYSEFWSSIDCCRSKLLFNSKKLQNTGRKSTKPSKGELVKFKLPVTDAVKSYTWLYLARRSDLQGAPVLIWPCFNRQVHVHQISLWNYHYKKNKVDNRKTYRCKPNRKVSNESILSFTTTSKQRYRVSKWLCEVDKWR